MPAEESALRPARALLGWLSAKQARGHLNAQRRDAELTDEQRRAVEQAHARVAARPKFEGGSAVLGPCPEILFEHRAALYGHERFSAMRNEGWEIAIVDLERVCVVQPTVLSDPDPRVETNLDPGDLMALAKITLPIPNPLVVPYQVDSAKNVAALSSPNPNLRIVGFRAQQIGQGTLLGFVVEIATSFVQVAEFGGRFVLTDGTHRAVSLFKQGIARIPALMRTYAHGENLGLAKSVLSPATYLGERPPQVGDYWNPAVSTAITVPRARKLVIVQAIEQSLVTGSG
jgi:hypothetical protein